MKDSIYYSDELKVVIIANKEGDKLYLLDVFSLNTIELNTVIERYVDKSVKYLTLGFTPLDDTDYEKHLLQPDDTLFVLKDTNHFKNMKWMFPILSHA